MSGLFDKGTGTDEREQFRQEFTAQQTQVETQRRSKSRLGIGILAGVLLLLLIVGGGACSTYNSLNGDLEQVRAAFSNVDTQLQRRSDLIPNFVNTVKGYVKHEEKVFGEIADARSRLLNAKDPNDRIAADNQLTGALGRLLMLTENYPNLKADQQFIRLQDELSGTENRIQVARRDYNQGATKYNTLRQRFPTVVFSNLMSFQRAELFQASESARQAPTVPDTFNK